MIKSDDVSDEVVMANKKKLDAMPRPFGRTSWLPYPRVLSTAVRIRFDLLAELHMLVEDAIDDRTADIVRTYITAETDSSREQNEVEEYGEYLAEELQQLEDIKREARLLHTVSLYHRLENELKTIFVWRFSGLNGAEKRTLMRSVHRWKALKKITQTYFNFDIASVADFRVVDKLRCIANAVKHKQGNVTDELHALTRWPLNKPIDVANIDMKGLQEACIGFFSAFAEKGERSMKATFGNPAEVRK